MKNRFLAIAMSFVLIFSLMPVAAFADDPSTPSTPSAPSTTAEALKAAMAEGGAVTLGANIVLTESLTVPADKTIDLNLGAFTVTGPSKQDLIKNEGTLTITGTGTLKASDTGGVLVNYPGATATLNGGTYSGENWYAIKNLGTMIINEGVTVNYLGTTNGISSLIANGWYDPSKPNITNDRDRQHETGQVAALTITGGSFAGGKNVVKNDEYGKLTISGGTFSESTSATILNWNDADITGGDFSTKSGTVITNSKMDSAGSSGALKISGESFKAIGQDTQDVVANKGGSVTISGGTIEANGTGGALVNYPEATATIEGGTITGDKWYTIKNLGTMTIGGNTSVAAEKTESSLIANGWYDSASKDTQVNDRNLKYQEGQSAKLTITAGTFIGGLNNVKNDEWGHLEISGGSFTSTSTSSAIMNWNECVIKGGTFTTGDKAVCVLSNGWSNDKHSQGILTITGGTFDGSQAREVITDSWWVENTPDGKGRVSIENAQIQGSKLFQDNRPVKFGVDIKNVESSFRIADEYIATNRAQVSLKSGSTTKYYVGDNAAISAYVRGAKSGDKIDVLKGNVALQGLGTGIVVRNSGTGAVQANGTTVARNQETTIATPSRNPDPKPTTPTTEKVTMYRLYNKWNGEHFYTSDTKERNHLISIGWNNEGTGWIAPKTGDPVYRLYNKYAGDHHYTTSATERDACVKAGWNYEGIGWYSDKSKKVPLYREYNPYAITGSHNYTTSKSEHDALIKAGWRNEGYAWYGI